MRRMVSDSELVSRLQDILRHSDLDTATTGSVRRQLEEDFGIDLSDRKSFVREQIDIFLETLNQDNEKQVDEEEAGEEEEEEVKDDEESENTRSGSKTDKQVKKRGGGFQKVCSLSPHLQKVVGESELPRTEVVKKLWSYIRENNLQDPKNRRNILCDESLHAIFRVNSINMFKMNKVLSKHIWPLSAEDDAENAEGEEMKEDREEEEEDEEEEEEEEEDKEENKEGKVKQEDREVEEEDEDEEENKEGKEEEEKEEKKEGKVKQEDREVEEEGLEEEEDDADEEPDHNARGCKNKRSKADKEFNRKRGGFTKLCSLSPELQAFLGEPELARTEVVKRLWIHIREKNLQDPKNKRNILCDESLHTIFRVNSINMFQMNKALSKHIWPLNEEDAQAGSAKIERKSKQVREEGDDEPKKKDKRQKKGVSGFLAPLLLSDALVNFFGTGEIALSRADVVKRMWDYIKQNDLQDPSDKRRILCDDKLKELFEVDSFHGFSITKLLTAHFVKMEQ